MLNHVLASSMPGILFKVRTYGNSNLTSYIVWYPKISIPTRRMVAGNFEGEWVPKAKFFKQARLENSRGVGGGGGVKVETIYHPWGMDIFLEPHISINILAFEVPLEFPIPSVGGKWIIYFHYLFIEK